MARDLSAYLEDIYDACVAIEEVTEAVSLQEYRAQRAVRSSVEHEFIIIGEALRRFSVLDERLFLSISNSRAIIDFRNLLAQDYGAVDVDSVFGLVHSDLIVKDHGSCWKHCDHLTPLKDSVQRMCDPWQKPASQCCVFVARRLKLADR